MKNMLSACPTISFISPSRSRSGNSPGGLSLRKITLKYGIHKIMSFLFLMDASDSWRTFDASNGRDQRARDEKWTSCRMIEIQEETSISVPDYANDLGYP